MEPRSVPSEYRTFVQILSLCFGFGSWIAMTGLWVELPLLTQSLPESWSLGSYLTVMIQLANVGPLLYWFARSRALVSEVVAIHIQMVIGTVSCLGLISWWDTTAVIFGVERSIVLYVCAFGLSIVDCTSSVVFLPYMARFKAHHMTPYLIGEGLSGFLPSLVALAQGVSENPDEHCSVTTNDTSTMSTGPELSRKLQEPNFSANVFFCFLLLILLTSWIAFTLMDCLGVCIQEKIDLDGPKSQEMDPLDANLTANLTLKDSDSDKTEHAKFIGRGDLIPGNPNRSESFRAAKKLQYIWLLGLMSWGCFTTFGAMPSLQPYSCLPYGGQTFFYAVTLAGLAYPAACVLGLFVDTRSPVMINALTVLGSGVGLYILVCAVMSPYPPLKGDMAGSVLMICSWISYVGIISYVKTMVSLEINDVGGNQGMFWCGIAQQFGAASGGALMFCVINFTDVFQEETKCN